MPDEIAWSTCRCEYTACPLHGVAPAASGAAVLTVDQAEALALDLIRQAGHVRTLLAAAEDAGPNRG